MGRLICRGCRAGECLFVKNQREELCICIECLVKVICNQWCEKRLSDTLKIFPLNRAHIK
jgi:hypothetical protein